MPATLKTMRIVVVVEQISYRLESQVQTLSKALAQCGRDDRFNGPFSACQQKRYGRDCHLSGKRYSDKLSSKTRKGSSELRDETPIK